MLKIAFLGAGSTIFAKNVLGDCMMTPALAEAHIALHDIDLKRLGESEKMLQTLNKNNGGKATVKAYADRREALRGATYVVNAITAGAFEPWIRQDHELPRKYGIKQTYADTLGVGGLFRGLRTVGAMFDFARDIEELCPDAWFLNYTNPMAILTGAMLRGTGVKTVGLCHSVQVCAKELLEGLGMSADDVRWKIAGINHQAWLLEISRRGVDLYPEIKRRAAARPGPHDDMVRYEIMNTFGHYVTESSMHGAEYVPYFLKNAYPELLTQYNIPTENYKGWGNSNDEYWGKVMTELLNNESLTHVRTHEYASYIMEAMETNVPYKIAGNVLNTGGLISNLPEEACVEVSCLVDAEGVTPTRFGALPEQLAGLNRTNINMQLLAVEAALTRKKEPIYYAALLDPHTSAELPIDRIKALVDDMFEANAEWLKDYK